MEFWYYAEWLVIAFIVFTSGHMLGSMTRSYKNKLTTKSKTE